MPGRYHNIDTLPRTIGIFPLTGVLLLPRAQLPLNVFEPRYLALVEAALAGNRLIGMIQPTEHEEKTLRPALSAIGCAGRVTGFRETDDNRYLITLTGVCRFRLTGEPDSGGAWRAGSCDFEPFAADLVPAESDDFPRDRMLKALNAYLSGRDMKADWNSVITAPGEALINALAMMCPFDPAGKQALLEAPTLAERISTLVALLEISGGDSGPVTLN